MEAISFVEYLIQFMRPIFMARFIGVSLRSRSEDKESSSSYFVKLTIFMVVHVDVASLYLYGKANLGAYDDCGNVAFFC